MSRDRVAPLALLAVAYEAFSRCPPVATQQHEAHTAVQPITHRCVHQRPLHIRIREAGPGGISVQADRVCCFSYSALNDRKMSSVNLKQERCHLLYCPLVQRNCAANSHSEYSYGSAVSSFGCDFSGWLVQDGASVAWYRQGVKPL